MKSGSSPLALPSFPKRLTPFAFHAKAPASQGFFNGKVAGSAAQGIDCRRDRREIPKSSESEPAEEKEAIRFFCENARLSVRIRYGEKRSPPRRQPDICNRNRRLVQPQGWRFLWGKPEMFNSDQGRGFTCSEFVAELRPHDIQISRNGHGRCLDHIPACRSSASESNPAEAH